MKDYKKRPETLAGFTSELMTGCGSIYITVNFDEKKEPFEVFAQLGKAGGCAASQTQSTARLATICLRSGVKIEQVVKQLISIRCHKAIEKPKSARVLSCADAIAKELKKYIVEEVKQDKKNKK